METKQKTINVCGFTYAQNNTKMSNRKGVISLSILLPKIFEDMGYNVTIGDFSGGADYNFVFIYTPSSLNSKFVIPALKLIKENPDNTILCLDDWNIKDIYNTIKRLFNGYRFKNHPHLIQEEIEKYFDVLKKIYDGKYNILIPAFFHSNKKLLGIKAKNLISIDPSIFCDYEQQEDNFDKKTRKFVYAGLCNKDAWIKKLNQFSVIKITGMKEKDVLKEYNKHWFILNPPHYHDGSGWWRNRYIMAAKANSILVDDKLLRKYSQPELIRLSKEELIKILYDQQEKLAVNCETKDFIHDKLKLLMGSLNG